MGQQGTQPNRLLSCYVCEAPSPELVSREICYYWFSVVITFALCFLSLSLSLSLSYLPFVYAQAQCICAHIGRSVSVVHVRYSGV